ncbi:uncharacterized protein BDZ99DRAFT_519956 [Mytilinidion resinicola]|uniref:2EXR domain-containing protein n=1 Tax=Mytilinidion resinicola TaxID=574789 RepID=A0A6A6YMT4_9PEZI|nr:uncharacterized protein BDZ99DRAFT_519956 [Mytilinidion resinicola]KAF2809858.1 hypothetical protein BDZ99DRAFT_519956 [Mytilinidion resinicola]
MPRHRYRRSRPPPKVKKEERNVVSPVSTAITKPKVPHAATSMHRFSQLPAELRVIVWENALEPVGRQVVTLSRNIGDTKITVTPPPIGIFSAQSEARAHARAEMYRRGYVLYLMTSTSFSRPVTEIYFNFDRDILHVHSDLSGTPPSPGQHRDSMYRKLATIAALLDPHQIGQVHYLAVSCLPDANKMSLQEETSATIELHKFKKLHSFRLVVNYVPEDLGKKYKTREEIGKMMKSLWEDIAGHIARHDRTWNKPYIQICLQELTCEDSRSETEMEEDEIFLEGDDGLSLELNTTLADLDDDVEEMLAGFYNSSQMHYD